MVGGQVSKGIIDSNSGALSGLENGHKEIGARALEKIAKALEVELKVFFDGI
jgi:transcriptional regulator with XRE-family HTH domain